MTGNFGFLPALIVSAAALIAAASPAHAVRAYFGFGVCEVAKYDGYSMKGAISRCVQLFATARKPEAKATGYFAVAQLYQIDHQYEFAVENYTKAIGWWHPAPEPYWGRGDSYLALGKTGLAETDFKRAAELSAAIPNAVANRCWLRAIRGGPFDRALMDCNDALKTKPNDPNILYSRCLVHYRLGEYAAAVSDCDAAMNRKFHQPGAYYVRGLAKARIGDTGGSSEDIAVAKGDTDDIAEQFAVLGVVP